MAKGSTYSEFTPVSGDRLLGVDDPGGTPVTGAVDVDSIALTANNLSDLASAATARTNLGVLASGSAVSDNTLRDWAGRVASMLTTATRTDYSTSYARTDDTTDFVGWIQVTATVTWPDGSSGHLDGVEHPDALGVLQYFTASHQDSGKIVVQSPLDDGVTGVTVITPDYYVDSAAAAGGNGSLATPYDAIADLPSLNSGDVVALKSGSTFAEKFTGVAGLSIYRYGAGNKPIIDAGVTFTAGSWSATAGRTNVYEQTVTIELHASTSFVNVLEDGAHLSRVANVATCDSTPASFTVSADTGSGDTSVTVYIHATGSTNPTTNGSTYRYSRRLHSIDTDLLASVTIDGIHGRLQTSEGGCIEAGDSATIRHCLAQYGNNHNMLVGESSTVRGCVFDQWESDVNRIVLAYNKGTATGGDVAISDCAAVNGGTYDSAADAFGGHINTGGTFGTVTIQRVYVADCRRVSAADDLTTLVIDNVYATNVLSVANVIANGTIKNVVANTGVASNRLFEMGAGSLTVTIDNVHLTPSVLPANAVIFDQNGCTITVRNSRLNGISASTSAANSALRSTHASTSWRSRGNVFTNFYRVYDVSFSAGNIYTDLNNFVSCNRARIDGTEYTGGLGANWVGATVALATGRGGVLGDATQDISSRIGW